jgi:hypothetical protein
MDNPNQEKGHLLMTWQIAFSKLEKKILKLVVGYPWLVFKNEFLFKKINSYSSF